jgi:hypothetical protein
MRFMARLREKWRRARLEDQLRALGYCFKHQLFRRYWSNYAGDGFESCKQCDIEAEQFAERRLARLEAEYKAAMHPRD